MSKSKQYRSIWHEIFAGIKSIFIRPALPKIRTTRKPKKKTSVKKSKPKVSKKVAKKKTKSKSKKKC